jgi:hypothetical protein
VPFAAGRSCYSIRVSAECSSFLPAPLYSRQMKHPEIIGRPDRFHDLALLATILFAPILPAIAGEINIPISVLPRVQSLPESRPLFLEIRQRIGCKGGLKEAQNGDCPQGRKVSSEFAVLEAATGKESEWELPKFPADAVSEQKQIFSACEAGEARGYSWAFDASRLLYVGCGAAYLVRPDGIIEQLNNPTLGKLRPYQGTSQYSVSSDAKRISYAVYLRDPTDRQPDGYGRLYRDLVAQDVSGLSLVTISKDSTTKYHGSLSPDGSRIAYYSETDKAFKIESIKGGETLRIGMPGRPTINEPVIGEIRWSPDGTKLATISNGGLFVLQLPGTKFVSVIQDEKVDNIASLAWSPDSRELAFRSSYEGKNTCSYGLDFSRGVLTMKQCANAYQLYAVDIETGNIRLLKASEEYRPKELYWIR